MKEGGISYVEQDLLEVRLVPPDIVALRMWFKPNKQLEGLSLSQTSQALRGLPDEVKEAEIGELLLKAPRLDLHNVQHLAQHLQDNLPTGFRG